MKGGSGGVVVMTTGSKTCLKSRRNAVEMTQRGKTSESEGRQSRNKSVKATWKQTMWELKVNSLPLSLLGGGWYSEGKTM